MGSYKQNYLTFVEGRLFMLIYRANFVNNIFKVKHVIDDGFFLVNGKRQYYSNYNVKPGELIQIGFKYRDLFKYDMIYRLKFKFMKRNSRDYLFVNLKFLFIFFIRSPFLKEIRFPIRIDILKGADFYFL
jgi:ribosomal protein S4